MHEKVLKDGCVLYLGDEGKIHYHFLPGRKEMQEVFSIAKTPEGFSC